MRKKRSAGRRFFTVLIVIILLAAAFVFGVGFYVDKTGDDKIIAQVTTQDFDISDSTIRELKAKNPQCIIILGAGVRIDGSPTKMLADRLEVGTALYKKGAAPKILLSGDNGKVEYNELKAMRKYVKSAGVPDKDIFLDYAGFSTYESMYRAKAVFCVKRAIVVTQKYHESRALYVGEKLGLDVWGVTSDQAVYSGQTMRDLREVVARDKDFIKCIYKPEPTFLGEQIPITGKGNI